MSTVFIDALHATERGKRILVNLLDSIEEDLVEEHMLRDFLSRCSVALAADPGGNPVRQFRDVCVGADGGVALQRFGRAPADDGVTLSTVTTWERWYEYHLDRAKLSDTADDSIPEFPPDTGDSAALAKLLSDTCSDSTWWKEGPDAAHLGAPKAYGGNVWISTRDHDTVLGAAVAGPETPVQVSCSLGLEYPPKTWLIRYTFAANEARAAVGEQIARPNVLDLGNDWFSVRVSTSFGRECAKLRWGATAHLLGNLLNQRDGRPERVALRLPFDGLPSLEATLVGMVAPSAADTMITEDEFLELLLDKRDMPSVVARLKHLFP